jgi:hypothetical protein
LNGIFLEPNENLLASKSPLGQFFGSAAKIDLKKGKFKIWKAGFSLLRAGSFSWRLKVLRGCLRKYTVGAESLCRCR